MAAAARMRLPELTAKAIALLDSEDAAVRANAAGALEICGGANAVGALIGVIEKHLADYSAIRAVEVISGHGTRMHFGDNQEEREAKLKAFKEWWATARTDFE